MTVRRSTVVPGVGQPWSLLPHVDGSLISSHLGKRERKTQNPETSKQGGALGSHLVNPFPHPAASTFSPAILKGPAPKRLHCRRKEASSRPQEERVGSGPRPASCLAATGCPHPHGPFLLPAPIPQRDSDRKLQDSRTIEFRLQYKN